MRTVVPVANRRRKRQRGYMLLAILLMLTLLVVALAAIAPSVATQIKRDREDELIHRGTAYARAIKRYYKKFGRYPMRIEDLENTNNIRFLRKRYKDPITGKDEWKLIHFGEATVQPKTFGNAAGGPASPSAPGLGGVGVQSPSGLSSPASSGTSMGSPIGTPAASMGTGPKGPTFGGGPIVGVASTSEKESLKELDGKDHYNEWEFVYDPRFDAQNATLPGQLGAPATPGAPTPGAPTSTSPFGQSIGPGGNPPPAQTTNPKQ